MKRISLRVPVDLWEQIQRYVLDEKISQGSYNVNQFGIEAFQELIKKIKLEKRENDLD